jgi:hypothetical protein
MACHPSKRIARIIGCGMTALRSGKAAQEHPSNAVALMVEALQLAVQDACINISDLDTLIALPSLMSEQHFMIGHAVAQQVKHGVHLGGPGCTPAAVLLLLQLLLVCCSSCRNNDSFTIMLRYCFILCKVSHADVFYHVRKPAIVLCAAQAHLTPRKGMLVRTLDVGGAGPVAALLAAKHAIEHEGRKAVAIVAGDTVASVPVAEFLARADGSCRPKKPDSRSSSNRATDGSAGSSSSSSADGTSSAENSGSSSGVDAWVPSPVIPNLYDRVARWHMQQYGTTREQLVSAFTVK